MYSYPRYQTHRPQPYGYGSEEEYYYPSRDIDYHHQYNYIDSPPIRKRKNHRRSRSFSKMDEERYHYMNENAYYQGPHRLDGVRSVSPPFTGRHYDYNSINRNMYNEEANNSRRAQPPCFVNLNGPMINPMTANYCMPQSLGTTCPTTTTNTFIPQNNNDFFYMPQNVPMIQPYFMNQPNNSNHFLSSYYHHQPVFPTFMPMPALHPDIILPQTLPSEEVVISSPNKEVPPVIETEVTKETTEAVPDQQQQVPLAPPAPAPPIVMLRRKRSIMEEILSSFALLGDGIDYAIPQTVSKPQKNDNQPVDDTKEKEVTRDQPLYTSLSEALDYGEKKPSSLSRKTSLKLYKKASALQNRQYIWCYRPFVEPKQTTDESEESSNALWAAFDMTNQAKLDYHYSFIMTHNQKHHNGDDATGTKPNIATVENNLPDMITDDPSLILMLHRQSTIPNPVMISFGDGKAWYYTIGGENEPECHMLEITCLPTHDRRLVVSNDLLQEEQSKPLRRSKSMDGLATKFLNTVFGW
ncbi:hypothetical protein INT47_000716 [Mucor saturninus]|uniref:Uncharacterized protein n=1 Tax=Mucor saturninus TaxID=64648 RepID=A0A8H7VFM1_9FUNG|nr:hypothetical protein INT47_000716 [Mucor saturninus]